MGMGESRRSARTTSRPSIPRQPQVQDHGVGAAGAREDQARLAVGGGEDGEPGLLEVVADEGRDPRLVLHDEDRAHAAPEARRRRPRIPGRRREGEGEGRRGSRLTAVLSAVVS